MVSISMIYKKFRRMRILVEYNENIKGIRPLVSRVLFSTSGSSVIYLHHKSPCGSSILPSTAAEASGGQPSSDGIHELATSGGTA